MAMRVKTSQFGVDVSKDWIDIFDGKTLVRILNKNEDIQAFIDGLEGPAELAVEPTNRYHRELVSLAVAAGHTVYLVDPFRVSRYRDAIGVRAKTDASDAQLLYRYLLAEGHQLKAYKPSSKVVQRLLDLLRVRANLTKIQVSLRQSLKDTEGLEKSMNAVHKELTAALKDIDRKMERLIRQSQYQETYQHCLSIPGIGPLNAAGLLAIFHRGSFRKADAFIAYLGLDVRVRDSGDYRGRRKLTKKGSAELRRLLFNAARSGARSPYWKPYYESLLQRGLSSTAAGVALARKLARVAFALMRDQTEFRGALAK